jgi:hypothetical protein
MRQIDRESTCLHVEDVASLDEALAGLGSTGAANRP